MKDKELGFWSWWKKGKKENLIKFFVAIILVCYFFLPLILALVFLFICVIFFNSVLIGGIGSIILALLWIFKTEYDLYKLECEK